MRPRTVLLFVVCLGACDRAAPSSDVAPAEPASAEGAVVDSLQAQARGFEEAAAYDSALVYQEKALALRRSMHGEQHPDVAQSYEAIGLLYYDQRSYDQALDPFDRALAIYRAARGDRHPDVARVLHRAGRAHWRRGDLEEALALYGRALEIYQRGEHAQQLADVYDDVGNIYRDQGDFERAFSNLDRALQLRTTALSPRHPDVARSYSNLGVLYDLKGDYGRAAEHYEDALALQRADLGDDHPDVAKSYHNMGITYYNVGDYDRALDYFGRALASKRRTLGDQDPSVGRSYSALGTVYYELGELDRAFAHYRRALALFEDVLGERHPHVGATYHNLGTLFDERGEHARALEHYRRSLDIEVEALGEQHPSVALTYHNMGNTYFDGGQSGEALAYHNRALDVQRATLGDFHPHVAASYQQLGLVHYEEGRHAEALHAFQRALQANVPGFTASDPRVDPALDGALSETYLLTSLHGKARTLAAQYAQTPAPDLPRLEAALATYRHAAQLVDRMRHGYRSEGSKLFLSQQTTGLYDDAIQTALRLHRVTDDPAYVREAFRFSEKSKAGVLLGALQEAEARQFAGVPDSLVERERQLRADLAFYERSLVEAQLEGEAADSTRVARWQDLAFGLREQYHALLARLEADYPDYYDLKYRTETAAVDDLQRHVLDERTALVEYFIGADSLYTFRLTTDDLTVTTRPHGGRLGEQVRAFREAIVAQDYARYTALGHELYALLLAPAREGLAADHLILIPDGILTHVPFEALLTAPAAENGLKDYRRLPYLLQEVATSYAYSATLLEQTQAPQTRMASADFIGFAPVFEQASDASDAPVLRAAAAVDSAWAQRSEVGALPASRDEVLAIRDLFRARYGLGERLRERVFGRRAVAYVEANAREARVKDPATSGYRFVHLATHGFSNETAPELSRLLMAPEEAGNVEDGQLYLGEVYTLSLNAELVVLSACETGLGHLAQGEGLIGLARGFLYAGAQNLVVSLWQATDGPTEALMVGFYDAMLQGQPRADALRAAKRAHVANGGAAAAPFYWAPFVLVGR